MDREIWEALPIGTNVRVTFDEGGTYTVIRIAKGGGSSGGFSLLGGRLWSEVLDWPATLEVIFNPDDAPTTKEN